MEAEKTGNKIFLNKGGRKPKTDKAVFRYSISMNAKEHEKFLSLFEHSGMQVKAHFIMACVFQRTIKTIKIDKASLDYYTRLTHLYGQFRAIGVNYNQIVKQLHAGFSEKKARFFLYKLEQETIKLATIGKEITELTKSFEKQFANPL